MVGRLILTLGLPGCGKSTYADDKLISNPNWVKIERDEIRRMFGVDCSNWTPEAEERVRKFQHFKIRFNLNRGKTVIVSDTNLSELTLKELYAIAEDYRCPVDVIDFRHVPVELCIERDAQRPAQERVGRSVILKLADLISLY